MAYNDTSFRPGQEKTTGSGRQKGTPNKRRGDAMPAPNQHTALVSGALTETVWTLMPQVLKNLHQLSYSRSPRDQVQFLSIFARLLPHVVPRGGGLSLLGPDTIATLAPSAPPNSDDGTKRSAPTHDDLPAHVQLAALLRDLTMNELGIKLDDILDGENHLPFGMSRETWKRLGEQADAYEAKKKAAAEKEQSTAISTLAPAPHDPFRQQDSDDD